MSSGGLFGILLSERIHQLPFLRLSQLKVLGVEYTVAVRQEEVANREFDDLSALERFRLSFINRMTSDNAFEQISQFVLDNRELDVPAVLGFLANFLQVSYEQSLSKNIVAGVIAVEAGRLVESDLIELKPDIQYNVRQAHKQNKAEFYSWEKKSVMAMPVKLFAEDASYCMFYIYSEDLIFSKTDELMINSVWQIIVTQVNMLPLMENIDDRAV